MAELAVWIHFECLSEKTTIIREVKLPPVTSVLQIKQYLESKHNVPVCMQTLRHRSVVLNEDTSIRSLRLRAGDELHVSYYAAAECEEVRSVIKWVQAILRFLTDGEYPADIDDTDPVLEHLSFELFLPWESPVKRANKQFFIVNGGLGFLVQLHEHFLHYEWCELREPLKLLESDVLSVLWNLSDTFPFRHAIIRLGGLKNCIMSLLRVAVHPDKPLEDTSATEETRYLFNIVLHSTIQRAIGLLTCFCEISSCHMEVATNMSAMQQVSNAICCPSFDGETVRNAVILCLSLAYSSETHCHLVDAGLMNSVLSIPSINQTDDGDGENVLLQYHIAVFLAQVVLASPRLTAGRVSEIHSFFSDFLKIAKPSEITSFEIKYSYLWATFLPYIKLIYQPNTPCREPLLLSETQDMALQTSIIALHSMLDRSIHREVLVREGLVDYLTCMPWYTTGSAQQRSRALVRMIQQSPDVDLQPPSLINMTKACVAKNYCGLQTVVQLSVPDIIQQICR